MVAVGPVAGEEADDGEDEDKFNYTVEDDDRVDESTMEGFTIYTGTCMPCHGPDGLGSAFAPSLIQAAERRSFSEFARTIAEGREIQPNQVMPSFADDERIMSHVEDIWNYLGARAEGGLGRGRPDLIEEEGADADDDEDEEGDD